MSAADASATRRLMRSWNEVPAEFDASRLSRLATEIEASLDGAGPEVTAVLLDKMFAVLPMPESRAALKIWNERLRRYPADVLGRAVDRVIDSHRWPKPPAIADLVDRCEHDLALDRRRRARDRIESAIQRLPGRDAAAERRATRCDADSVHDIRVRYPEPTDGETPRRTVARARKSISGVASKIVAEAAAMGLPKLRPDDVPEDEMKAEYDHDAR